MGTRSLAGTRGRTQTERDRETLLGEVLALRTILLNLHFAVAKGETITAEAMQAIIDRADAGKAKKAAERLEAASKEKHG